MKMFQKCFLQFVSRITLMWCHICSCVECPCGRWKQYAWIHAISSKMHAGWFFYPSNCQSHTLKRSTWLDGTTWLVKIICLIYGVWITLDYGSSLVTGYMLLFSQCYVCDHFLVLYYAPWASLISFSIPTLAAGAGTIPSGPATFSPCWTHSLVLTWFPWNCRVNGICYLDPTPLQITTLWVLHSVYNDKVCEISEVFSFLNRLLDCQYMRLGLTNLPRRFK